MHGARLEVLDGPGPEWPSSASLALAPPGLGLALDGPAGVVSRGVDAADAVVRLLPDGARWQLEPAREAWRVLVNGQRAWSGTLTHGDVISVGELVFRFVLRPWPGDSQASLETELTRSEPGDARWPVYRDWLLDRGSARGELGDPPTVDDGARWFWSLADLLQKGHLEVTWANGFPRTLTVRKLTRSPGPLAWKQARAGLEHVRRIELVADADTAFRLGPPFLSFLAEAATALPQLETVSFGVLDAWLPDDTVREALEALRRLVPRLTTTAETLATVSRHPGEARLWLISQTPGAGLVGLTRDEPLVLRAGDSVTFRRRADGQHVVLRHAPLLREDAVRLHHAPSQGVWHVLAPVHRRGVEVPRLNGRPLAGFRLKHGDLVELVPGVSTRFTLD